MMPVAYYGFRLVIFAAYAQHPECSIQAGWMLEAKHPECCRRSILNAAQAPNSRLHKIFYSLGKKRNFKLHTLHAIKFKCLVFAAVVT
jgi:hypothetical protein